MIQEQARKGVKWNFGNCSVINLEIEKKQLSLWLEMTIKQQEK
jgi:hypothetical protein